MELSEIEIENKENGISMDRRYLYVCEGNTDEDKLKKTGCLFVIKTGGKYIRSEIIKFLKRANEVRTVVLVLDPDGPGRLIEEKLTKSLSNLLVIHADKKKAIKNDKVGIAEMELKDVKELLRPFIRHDLTVDENLSLEDEDFFDLGLCGAGSREKRDKLIRKYDIPYLSSKNVEDCLMMLGRSKEDIKADLNND